MTAPFTGRELGSMESLTGSSRSKADRSPASQARITRYLTSEKLGGGDEIGKDL